VKARPLILALACAALLCLVGGALATAAILTPTGNKLLYATGRIVPIPASIPHEAGDMVDRRIVPDLRWIAERFPIFVTDGYSGPLPSGRHVGCDECHVTDSDHYNGLAVDIVALNGGTKCDAGWAPITRLALWAEPVQGEPRPPFRWVGYDGDAGHGCGNHLHLSWNHSVVPRFQLAEWVEVFPAGAGETVGAPPKQPAKPAAPPGPSGGISRAQTGGVGTHGD
jgi:hypothetical protein